MWTTALSGKRRCIAAGVGHLNSATPPQTEFAADGMALWPVDVFTIEQSLSDEYVIMLFVYDPLLTTHYHHSLSKRPELCRIRV